MTKEGHDREAVGKSKKSFAEAAQKAAQDASDKGWARRRHSRKQVRLEVDLSITNPGRIDEYRVIIEP